MSTLEDIKKSFPNMFRPLKWHHFDGPTEHGCGEWYAHATRGMYHIYDVREKFPNDRPFYAKELSGQFDTLEQAQDAVQNRHELDIVMCLDPDFRSTLESLQRENEEKSAWIKAATTEITKAIGGGSEMFTKHGDEFRVDPAFVATFIQFRRERHAESKKASIQKERELLARAEAAEAKVKQLTESRDGYVKQRDQLQKLYDDERASCIREAKLATDMAADCNDAQARAELAEAQANRLREALEAVLAAHDIKSVKGELLENVIASATERARTALASTGGEHHGN